MSQTFDLIAHLRRQREFSLKTFGDGGQHRRLLKHIFTELMELSSDPANLDEWADVILLALDGAWRTGNTPEIVAQAILLKQAKNEARTWPAPGAVGDDEPFAHVRDGGASTMAWIDVRTRVPDDRREVLVWGYSFSFGIRSLRPAGHLLGLTRFNPSRNGGRFDVEHSTWSGSYEVTHWCEIEAPGIGKLKTPRPDASDLVLPCDGHPSKAVGP